MDTPKLPVGWRGGFMNTHSIAFDAGTVSVPRSEALRAALIAAVLGVGLVFLTGFAHTLVLHNGAHDTRHALSFPCH
jgi:cobalt transporter subunit CbtB